MGHGLRLFVNDLDSEGERPLTLGVPKITPVDFVSWSPFGSSPDDSDHR
jgi:hypothetical protein